MSKKPDINILETPNAVVLLLNAILQKISLYTQHLDIQSNIIIALSSAIMIFSASRIVEQTLPNSSWSLLILVVSSALSAIVALFAVNPPHFMRKKGQKESLFYHSAIAKYDSPEDYYNNFRKMMQNEDDYVKEMTKEIYNLSSFSYLPKRTLSNLSVGILTGGLFLSFSTFILHTVLNFF